MKNAANVVKKIHITRAAGPNDELKSTSSSNLVAASSSKTPTKKSKKQSTAATKLKPCENALQQFRKKYNFTTSACAIYVSQAHKLYVNAIIEIPDHVPNPLAYASITVYSRTHLKIVAKLIEFNALQQLLDKEKYVLASYFDDAGVLWQTMEPHEWPYFDVSDGDADKVSPQITIPPTKSINEDLLATIPDLQPQPYCDLSSVDIFMSTSTVYVDTDQISEENPEFEKASHDFLEVILIYSFSL